jgi:hypothetical protein
MVVKILHRQSEQGLTGRIDPNRPPRVEFAQGTADREIFLAAEQGGVRIRIRGVHLQGLSNTGRVRGTPKVRNHSVINHMDF